MILKIYTSLNHLFLFILTKATKPLTNPAHFAFTNHFNQSMLKKRVQMMNRRPSSCNAWRYFTFGFVAFSTMMCQPSIHSESITDTQKKLWEQKKLEVDNKNDIDIFVDG